MENENPIISKNLRPRYNLQLDEFKKLKILNNEQIFELIRDIKDPEHPHTLEQLHVVDYEDIYISQTDKTQIEDSVTCTKGLPITHIKIIFTPTVPHCSMAGIIGLSLYYKLYKHVNNSLFTIIIKEGSHSTEYAINKQLSDKDRVMAAFENEDLLEVLIGCSE